MILIGWTQWTTGEKLVPNDASIFNHEECISFPKDGWWEQFRSSSIVFLHVPSRPGVSSFCFIKSNCSKQQPNPWSLTDMPGHGHNISMDDHLPKRLRQSGNGKDVFCMVKARMACTSLSQPPLLVYPEAFAHGTERFCNSINSTNLVVKQSLDNNGERVKELQKLADAIEQDYPHLHRTVSYYRSLLDGDRYRRPYSRLAFIEAGPKATACLSHVQLGKRPVDPKPHCLQVVFHHGGGGWSLNLSGFEMGLH